MNTSKAREERLAAALRQNLRRRKAQATSRDTASGETDRSQQTASDAGNPGGDGERDS